MLLEDLGYTPILEFSLSHAVKFHDTLNPSLFENHKLKPEIKRALLKIAKDFETYLKVDLDIIDITISGSNAAYTYTPQSDIDLHLVVNLPDDEVLKELLTAKKTLYNSTFDITVKGIDVELYAQDSKEEHHSQGIYSILNDTWISKPKKVKPSIDDEEVREKYENYKERIKVVLDSDNMDMLNHTWDTIKKIRQAGLDRQGEFSVENLVFKMLRAKGWIERLRNQIDELQGQKLSIETREKNES